MNDYDNDNDAEDDWTVGVRTPRTEIETEFGDQVLVESTCPFTSGRPSKNTYLAGITFDNPSKGRQVCLYYQNERDEIVQAHLKWNSSLGTWEKVRKACGIKIIGADNWPQPKRNTPIAAVAWGNGKFIWIYYIEREWGILAELMSSDGGGTWFPGSLRAQSDFINLNVPVRCNSQLAAALSCVEGGGITISVWYQDGDNRIRQLLWEETANAGGDKGKGKWKNGHIAQEKARGGTNLACMRTADWDTSREWVYYQGADGKIIECYYERQSHGNREQWKTYRPFKEIYPLHTPITALLAYPPTDPRVYLKSTQNNIVQEWHTNCYWQERKILPLSNYIIKNRFVGLNWLLDNGETEIHIFSLDSSERGHSKLFAYVIGDVPAAIEVGIED